ncbi:uncharacterized protein LOC144052624 [Vanacampus margaritifer]
MRSSSVREDKMAVQATPKTLLWRKTNAECVRVEQFTYTDRLEQRKMVCLHYHLCQSREAVRRPEEGPKKRKKIIKIQHRPDTTHRATNQSPSPTSETSKIPSFPLSQFGLQCALFFSRVGVQNPRGCYYSSVKAGVFLQRLSSAFSRIPSTLVPY